jgi:capsule polysaccharide export protein KpsE/RkpR
MLFNRTLGKFVQYEEPEIVNYKACWEALRDHVDHVIDRLSENKESSRNASALLSAYLDISNQMKFIEELDLNSHWAKLSTADKIKALQNVDIQ